MCKLTATQKDEIRRLVDYATQTNKRDKLLEWIANTEQTLNHTQHDAHLINIKKDVRHVAKSLNISLTERDIINITDSIVSAFDRNSYLTTVQDHLLYYDKQRKGEKNYASCTQ